MASISVGGGAGAGQQPTDLPLELGIWDGSLVRYLKGNTSGNPEVAGATADGSPPVSNPVLVALKSGSNVKTIGGNDLGQVFVNTEGRKKTYSFSIIGYAPVASATDIINIAGSGTKQVNISRIGISGAASTANVIDVQIVKYSTAFSGSTPVALTAVPHDSSVPNAAAATCAVVKMTSANPTLGTAIGAVRARKLPLATIGGTVMAPQIEFLFGKDNGQELILHGVAESVSINLNGASVPSGTVLDIEIEVTEE